MAKQVQLFTCVQCGTQYNPMKTRAGLRGFCSMACQHALSYELGWRPNLPRGEYIIVKDELRRRRETIAGAEPLETKTALTSDHKG